MLEKGVAKRWKIIKNVIQKGYETLEKTRIKNKRNKHRKRDEKKGRGAELDLPKCAENTIRSKIEDKLTEEKLKDRGSAAYANTPWAPSGPERIEFACGKVPLRAHRDGGVRRSGRLKCNHDKIRHCVLCFVSR